MNFETTLILVWISVLLFATTIIYSLWWSLFWDRSRGQRRCPKCWHHVQERFPFRCNECGYLTIFEGNLFRTRRRYGWATIAILALMTGTLWLRDQLSTRSWWSLFPDRMVIAMLPLADDGETFREIPLYLANCLMRGEMSDANRLRLLSQCVQGDSWATPGSYQWLNKFASIVEKIDLFPPTAPVSDATMDEIEQGLNALAPVIILDMPLKWNSVEPIFISVNVMDWWPAQSEVTLRVTAVNDIPVTASALERLTHEVWQRATAANANNTTFTINFDSLPVGTHNGEISIAWESNLPASTNAPLGSHAKGVVTKSVNIDVQPTKEILSPISNSELDALVKEAFEPGLIRWPEGNARHAFSYQPYKTSSSELDAVAFGMIVEAMENGVPRRRLNVWWRGGRGGSRTGFEIVLEDQIALDHAEKSENWTLRIRGDEILARRVAGMYGNAPITQWWSGQVEIPMNVSDRTSDRTTGRSDRGRAWVLQEPAADVKPKSN